MLIGRVLWADAVLSSLAIEKQRVPAEKIEVRAIRMLFANSCWTSLKSGLLVASILVMTGCGEPSLDIARARAYDRVLEEYAFPVGTTLEEYELVDVWVEKKRRSELLYLHINIRGPHVDTEPRIDLSGPRIPSYSYTASDGNGLIRVCYRINSLPETIKLSRGEDEVTLRVIDDN